MKISFTDLLTEVLQKKASDIHISAGAPVLLRIDGDLVPTEKLGTKVLSPEESRELCFTFCSEEMTKALEEKREIDFSFGFEGKSRFRANIYYQMHTVSGAFRPIPHIIPTMEEIGLPDAMKRMTELPRGLVLITGPTGAGKSTSLAAMIGHINETRGEHVITIEDPIEFVHESKKSLISHREVEKDTHSFINALKFALRQDPDIVLIGEMRDLETISAAITIAETGHLVFATLHTNNAVQTINRIIDVFPSHQQIQVRTQLSFILAGIISQQLIPKIGGGRTLALEVMVPTHAIRNLIREDKIHQLYASMQLSQRETGMFTMNQSLAKLAKDGVITKEHAVEFATDVEEVKKVLGIKDKESA